MPFFSNAVERFCRKHPQFGISNFMRYIIAGTVAVYLLYMLDSSGRLIGLLTLSPDLVLKGQIWRLVTFLFIPVDFNPFFLLLSLYFYHWIGGALERQWGAGPFTIYYFTGVLLTFLYGFIYHFISGASGTEITAFYIYTSMFFAFATLFPDVQIMLFFILPIKVKWLGLFNGLLFLFGILSETFPMNLLPVLGILNYLLFCGRDLYDYLRRSFRPMPRARRSPFKKVDKKTTGGYSRKCAVCGKTDTAYPGLEFRYCSRCTGYHCFCSEHINNHVHFGE